MEKEIELKKEQEHFDCLTSYSKEHLDAMMDEYYDILGHYKHHPEHFRTAYDAICHKMKPLENGVEKPYFARIDYKDEEGNIQTHYIGKYTMMDDDLNMLVTDWRAPVSNLYYDSDLGETSYNSPKGQVDVELLLKRQFDIENGKLKDYYDVDLVSNDVLLQKYLNENNDARLTNIVATIQSEQNAAIRQPINKNIIVQGVAGSGKTTIALHRIAYLAYQYRIKVKNSQYLVIGPNDVFLKYVKGVLPDLDVDKIEETTYETFVKNMIGEPKLNIKNSIKKQIQIISGKANSGISKFKSSLKFKDMIDKYVDDYIMNIANDDLVINGFKILDKSKIRVLLETAIDDTNNFDKAIDRFVLISSAYIENHMQEISFSFNEQTKKAFEQSKLTNTVEKCRDEIKIARDELRKNCQSSLRKYINKYKTEPIKLYKKFINNIDSYNIYNYEDMKQLKKETLDNYKNNEFDFEDLTPLLFIKYKLGLDGYENDYRHVVIDEAQDLGEFNFYTIKACLPNASFSIFGDIAQSIYDYRGINSWDSVSNIIGDCEVLEFNKSYRTTSEIMNVANEISKKLDVNPAELTVRSGEDVSFEQVNEEALVTTIKDRIEEYKELGYKTIGIISKYPLQASYLNDDLSFEGLFISNIDENTDITEKGNEIVTISNSLAKGLEFDAVILHNVDEKVYSSENPADLKLLYVALTRALHKLDVIYTDKICEPLQKFVDKEKVLKKV